MASSPALSPDQDSSSLVRILPRPSLLSSTRPPSGPCASPSSLSPCRPDPAALQLSFPPPKAGTLPSHPDPDAKHSCRSLYALPPPFLHKRNERKVFQAHCDSPGAPEASQHLSTWAPPVLEIRAASSFLPPLLLPLCLLFSFCGEPSLPMEAHNAGKLMFFPYLPSSFPTSVTASPSSS